MKTIILVWTYNASNIKTDKDYGYWGIGDLLRGAIKMFQLSKKLDFKLIMDIQLHPLSKYLKKQDHDYESLILENKDNIPFIFPDNVENYILENEDKDVLFFITNDLYKEPITEECKSFIKNLLTMNEDFSCYFEERKKEIKMDTYNILHFRLGDREILEKNNRTYDNEFSILKNKLEKNDILMSDSLQFKKYVKENYSDIFIFDTNICHLGYCVELNSIKETLFEFFIITQSKKIKPYSIYHWTSGFIKIANEIYEVEII